ncbi:MAG: hypothetical protein LUI39_02485 [Lachnospiraceae bacterium]|nr:hypothetical protein [Lachnospiraceae bacterium]
MLKEYIENLQDENDRKISGFEQEMQELVTDLSCAEHMMEELQREKRLDTTIFSPRAIKKNIDENLNEKQEEIRQLKQRMEYVSQLIEDSLKKREEYQILKDELYHETSENKEISDEVIINNETPDKEDPLDHDDSEKNDFVPVQDSSENEDHESEHSTIEETINKEELLSLLKTVYDKTETSIAFLNGNKNRCRAELKNCLKLIKDYAQQIQNK